MLVESAAIPIASAVAADSARSLIPISPAHCGAFIFGSALTNHSRVCFNKNMREFTPFPKLARLTKDVIVTEKLDGTNAAIVVTDYGDVYAQSRNRIITPTEDNYGFAKWVSANATELVEKLGVGVHFGEWWGSGIERGYGLKEKRFSLFATHRFQGDPHNEYRCLECPICFVVPVLGTTAFIDAEQSIDTIFNELKRTGSVAAPGFDNPEGIVLYHTASKTLYKHTYEFSNGKWAG